METWTVVTIVIKENVLEGNWLTLRDERQHKDKKLVMKFMINFCLASTC